MKLKWDLKNKNNISLLQIYLYCINLRYTFVVLELLRKRNSNLSTRSPIQII